MCTKIEQFLRFFFKNFTTSFNYKFDNLENKIVLDSVNQLEDTICQHVLNKEIEFNSVNLIQLII